MIKNKVILEVKLNDRIYEMTLDPNSPLGEVFDALCMMQGEVMEKMKAVQPVKIDPPVNPCCSESVSPVEPVQS